MRVTVVALGLAMLAGCGSTSASQTTFDGSDTTVAAQHRTPTRTTAAAQHQTQTAVEKPDALVFGPLGVGRLRLRMTAAEVNATGKATVAQGSREDGWRVGCGVLSYTQYRVPTTNGVVSAEAGLEQLTASRDMRTPEGIGIGSSIEEVNAAFPGARARPWYYLRLRASDISVYRIQLSEHRVSSLTLELERRHCTR